MKLQKLEQYHIEYMKEHGLHKDRWKDMSGDAQYNYALEHEGDTLGMGGFIMVGQTCAITWFDMSEKAQEHLIDSFRTLKTWTETFCADHGIKRVMAFVETGFEAGVRTVEHLGYHFESRMPKYEDDRPFDIWVKFFEESK